MIYRYACFGVKQRASNAAPNSCVFFASVADVWAWADVKRLDPDNPHNIQRKDNWTKIYSIKRFFSSDERNTIPTAIIVSLTGASIQAVTLPNDAPSSLKAIAGASKLSTLEISVNNGQEKPGLVIDGQHRLMGMKEFDPQMPIPVVAILDATPTEVGFQFVVINNKVSKVPPDHVRALRLNLDDYDLNGRLNKVRLSIGKGYMVVGFVDLEDDSPFKGLIKWPNNENGFVPPVAIENAVRYIQKAGPRELEGDDESQELFLTVWRRVHEKWNGVWKKDSKLLDKIGVVCLTQFIVDLLVQWARLPEPSLELNLLNPDSVGQYTDRILDYLEPEFWIAKWTAVSLDTKAGHDLVRRALQRIYENKKHGLTWYDDVSLVDRPE